MNTYLDISRAIIAESLPLNIVDNQAQTRNSFEAQVAKYQVTRFLFPLVLLASFNPKSNTTGRNRHFCINDLGRPMKKKAFT